MTQGEAEHAEDEDTAPLPAAQAGEHWGGFTIDRTSRFVVAWAAGKRDAELARRVVRCTRARTAGRASIGGISDGWLPYEEALRQAYYDPVPAPGVPWELSLPAPGVALTQAVKHRKGRKLERRELRAVLGEQAAQPYPVSVERQNGVLRDRLACLTRKTHAFAKRPATWDACFSLALCEHHWLLPHRALRQPLAEPVDGRRYDQRTPAMALGLADHPWSLVAFLTRPAYHGM